MTHRQLAVIRALGDVMQAASRASLETRCSTCGSDKRMEWDGDPEIFDWGHVHSIMAQVVVLAESAMGFVYGMKPIDPGD